MRCGCAQPCPQIAASDGDPPSRWRRQLFNKCVLGSGIHIYPSLTLSRIPRKYYVILRHLEKLEWHNRDCLIHSLSTLLQGVKFHSANWLSPGLSNCSPFPFSYSSASPSSWLPLLVSPHGCRQSLSISSPTVPKPIYGRPSPRPGRSLLQRWPRKPSKIRHKHLPCLLAHQNL